MKQVFALLLTVILLISAVVLPALAEETPEPEVDQSASATVQAGKAGRGSQPQMPGSRQNPRRPGQNGQMPRQPDQNNWNGQQQAPDDNQNEQQVTPDKGNRNMKHSNRNANAGKAGKAEKQTLLDQMLKDGVITQEVYDTITNYMKEHAPHQPESSSAQAEGSEPSALPEEKTPDDGGEAQAAPEEQPEAVEQRLLRELLDNGAITQEQYDLIMSKLTASDAAAETAGSM